MTHSLITILLLVARPSLQAPNGVPPGLRVSGHVSTPAAQLAQTKVTMSGPVALEMKPNADSTFEFTNVPPGRYVIRAEVDRLLGLAEVVAVSERDIRDIELRLPTLPNQVRISGRVVIQGDGTPLNSQAEIRAIKLNPGGTIRNSSTTPAPDGNFTLMVEPGQHRVTLNRLAAGLSLTSMMFGSVDLIKESLTVESVVSETIVVTITATTVAGFRVSGTALDSTGKLPSGLHRVILTTGNQVLSPPIAEAQLNPDGSFEFPRVAPGTYIARIIEDPFGVTQRIDITDADVSRVRIPIALRWEVTGKISGEHGESLSYLPTNLMSFTRTGGGFTPSMGNDGSFRVRLPEGEYRIAFDRLPTETMVKSITAGGTDLLKNPFVIASEPPPSVLITLGPAAVPPRTPPPIQKERSLPGRVLRAIGRWFSK